MAKKYIITVYDENGNEIQIIAIQGKTPHIGENGHWFIGKVDTGVPSSGGPSDASALPAEIPDGIPPETQKNTQAILNALAKIKSGGGGGTSDHSLLTNRDAPEQHPIGAITGLQNALNSKQPKGDYVTEESDPTVPTWAKQPQKPSYTASEVSADVPSGVEAAENLQSIVNAISQKQSTPGPKGDPGKDGSPGKDGYTPVKGVDYWTESDKSEIVNDVLAKLPVAEGGAY